MKTRYAFAFVAAAAILAAVPAELVAAETFPLKPITLIVPGAPGGTTDFTARLIADPLSRALGQPVIVDNKAGGNGNIANQMVARSKADGYTLLVAYSGYQVGSPHLFKNNGWDPIKDFAPVAMVTRAPQIIAGRADLPANNVKALIEYAKANPGKLNYASSGSGSIQHIAGELFKQQTGTFMTHIPYKGAGPAVQDLLGGSVDLLITTPASLIGHVQANKLKALAVASPTRLPSMPNIPTAAEAGLKGYELDSWFALYAPAGTPPEVIQQLNAEINKILQLPDIQKKAEDSGTSVEAMAPQRLAVFTASELVRWGKIIKGAAITVD